MTTCGKTAARLNVEETSLFCAQAAMVLKSGIPLVEGLAALCADFRDTRAGAPLDALAAALKRTGALGAALEVVPVLPPYAMRMIRVGEQSGKLDDVLATLGDVYTRETRVRRNLRQAVLYPAVLTLLMGAVIAVVVFCVMPVFAQVLRNLGVGLYATTEGVMRAGMIIGVAALALVVVFLLTATVVALFLRTRRRGRVLALLCRLIPALRRVMFALRAERFASAMALLLGSGYPLEDALPLVEDLSGTGEMRGKVERIETAMAGGASFSDAVARSGIFDALHARMLYAGAAAGRTDAVLARVADIYAERFDREVANAEALIEPLLVTLLAIIAGAILLSVMLPLAGVLSSLM